MSRRIFVTALSVLLLVLLVGCAGGTNNGGTSDVSDTSSTNGSTTGTTTTTTVVTTTTTESSTTPTTKPPSTGPVNFGFRKAFGKNMVLQADKPISLFGYGKAGDELTVSVVKDSDGSVVASQKTTVDANGEWKVLMEKTVAGSYDTYTLKVNRDAAEVSLVNVVFGQVWLASGQSNMEWTLAKDFNVEDIKNQKRNTNIRVMHSMGWSPTTALKSPNGIWSVADKWNKISEVWAVGY